jgi:ribosome maturation factor RimP
MNEGTRKGSLNFIKIAFMIDQQLIQNLIQEKVQGTGYELITLKISVQNEILIEVDKLEGVDVDFCAELNHYLVEQLDAQSIEDYSLEVGSVSLTAPFVTKMQYQKHLGHDVEVLAADGKKYRGTLVSVDEESFALDTEVMVAVEGKKRKQKEIQTLTWAYDDVKYTKYDLKF